MSKEVDAVALVRRIRDDMYEQTKDMSSAELVEFFKRHGASAKETISHIQEQRLLTPKQRAPAGPGV
jgi:hypothetical protein